MAIAIFLTFLEGSGTARQGSLTPLIGVMTLGPLAASALAIGLGGLPGAEWYFGRKLDDSTVPPSRGFRLTLTLSGLLLVWGTGLCCVEVARRLL